MCARGRLVPLLLLAAALACASRARAAAAATRATAGAETPGSAVGLAPAAASRARASPRQHFLIVPTAVSTSESLDVLHVLAELAVRGHACSVLASAPIAGFYEDALAGYTAAARADRGLPPPPTGGPPPCRFLVYPDTTPGGVAAALQSALSGGAGGGGFVERHNPLRLLGRMNGWLATRCRAMLLDAGVRGLLEHEAARGGTCGSGAGEEGGGLPPVSAVLVNFPDQCSCIVANILGAPLLEANGNPWVQAPLAVPQFMAGVTPEDLRTSWRAWLRNARQWALLQLMPYATPRRLWRDLRAELSLAPEDNAPGAPLLSTCRPLEPRVRLLAPELEFPRPLPPGYAVVGAISPRPAEGGTPSDPGLAAFVDGAQGGLVLAGFGSTPVYGRSLGPRDYTEIAAAFASLGDLRLPGRGAGGVRVLWGVRDSALPEGLAPGDLGLGGNTRVVAWYPDNEVLAHPNTLAFVTHCGLHSVYGGAFHGVPLVGLPFTAEQLDNDLKARSRGLAVTCPDAPVFAPRGFDRCGVAEPAGEGRGGRGCAAIRAEVLVGSIKEVLLNGSYAAAARRVGRLMRARYAIRPPLQLAADEIELALLAAGVGGGGGGGLLAGEQPENSAAGPASH